MSKIIDKKRSIGEVTKEIGLETHVIRFWESKFPQIKPQIGNGGRRYYFDKEVAVLNKIKSLLYDEGYSIAGLQKLLTKRKKSDLKEQNIEFLLADGAQDINHKDSNTKNIVTNNSTNPDYLDPSQTNYNKLNNLTNALKPEAIADIKQIISQIESNLKKIENVPSSVST